MFLQSFHGSTFTLQMQGYAAPDAEDYFDANWLEVYLAVHTPAGTWQATTPCLLTYEVGWLADWLDALAAGRATKARLDFLGPCLAFLAATAQGEPPALRICFESEARPAWAFNHCMGWNDLWVEFPLAEIDLHRAADELRTELARYPERLPRRSLAFQGV